MKGVCVVCGKEAELIEYEKTDMFRPYDGYCNECKDKSFKLQMEQLDYKISAFSGIIIIQAGAAQTSPRLDRY